MSLNQKPSKKLLNKGGIVFGAGKEFVKQERQKRVDTTIGTQLQDFGVGL